MLNKSNRDTVMSLDQARLFIEKMKSDEAFAKRVMGIEDVAGRLACIQSEGFDCSEAEIMEVSGELSDKDLDAAGGGSTGCAMGVYWCFSLR
jgi:predicted ribosomally synthesized peptide with nif11-like leader